MNDVLLIISVWVMFGAAASLAFDLLVMARRYRCPETRRGLLIGAAVGGALGPIVLCAIALTWWSCADQERQHQQTMERMRESHERRMAEMRREHERRMEMIRAGVNPGPWIPRAWVP